MRRVRKAKLGTWIDFAWSLAMLLLTALASMAVYFDLSGISHH